MSDARVFVLAPESDDPCEFLEQVSFALDLLTSASADAAIVLDVGQRSLVAEARKKLDQVTAELRRDGMAV